MSILYHHVGYLLCQDDNFVNVHGFLSINVDPDLGFDHAKKTKSDPESKSGSMLTDESLSTQIIWIRILNTVFIDTCCLRDFLHASHFNWQYVGIRSWNEAVAAVCICYHHPLKGQSNEIFDLNFFFCSSFL